MKISTSMLYSQVSRDLSQNTEILFKLNGQISSGKRINSPSDDPIGLTSVLGYQTDLSSYTQYGKAIDYSTGWLNNMQSNLQDTDDILARATELAVQQASSTATSDTRTGAAEEVMQLRKEVLSNANAQYGNKYIFSGTRTQTQPYLDVDVSKWQEDVTDMAETIATSAPAVPAAGDRYIDMAAGVTHNHIFEYSTSSGWVDQGLPADGTTYIDTAAGATHNHVFEYTTASGSVDQGLPAEGTRFINTAAGAMQNHILQYNTATSSWDDQNEPPDGTAVVVNDKDTMYVFTGGQWKNIYQGNDSTFSVQIGKGSTAQTNIPGSEVYTNQQGNAYMSLLRLEKALRDNDQAGISAELSNIDNSGTVINNNLAKIGAIVNKLKHTKTVLGTSTVDTKTDMSNIQDLDFAAAITSLQNQQTIYQATLKSASMITGLSLVDYIR